MTPEDARPRRGAPPFRRVLVATDFRPESKRAFRKALLLTRALDAELHLLHVGHAPDTRSVFFISIPPHSREVICLRMRARARKRFEDFLRGEDLGDVQIRTEYREGRPHEQILAYATQAGADLIVVGERPETRAQHVLQHLTFESVGEKVRREAQCPVLTIR